MRHALIALLMIASTALASERRVDIVLPFNLTGTSGQVALMLRDAFDAEGIRASVVQKPGAAGVVGLNYLASARADGGVLGIATTAALFPSEHREVATYTENSFTFLTTLGAQAFVLVSGRGTVADFIAAANGRASATFGATSIGQFNALRAINSAARAVLLVPYSNAAQLFMDVAESRIDFSIATVAAVLPHLASGKIRPLAVTSRRRVGVLPEVPALSESVRGYEYVSHLFIAAPVGTPEAALQSHTAFLRRFYAAERSRLQSDPIHLIPVGFGSSEAIAAVKRARQQMI
jgi:tripartite-type tricarboxylate transporter receptor subunit TctC